MNKKIVSKKNLRTRKKAFHIEDGDDLCSKSEMIKKENFNPYLVFEKYYLFEVRKENFNFKKKKFVSSN